jgi:hypothetical protein
LNEDVAPKRIIDTSSIFLPFLDWVGRILALYWIFGQFRKAAESKWLLLSSMKAVRWLTVFRYSLPERKLPASQYPVTIPLNAIRSPFLNLMNEIHLRLAFRYNPKAWYAWKSLTLWTLRWQLRDSSVIDLRFTLQPIAYPERLT